MVSRVTMARLLFLLGLFLSVVPMLLRAENPGGWVADYEVATKLAAERQRLIFVLFTNSKTCAPCRILKENVLSKKEFLEYADKNLVLLQIDYAPYLDRENKKELSEIESDKKVPKDLWMKGRGPWPYLFVLTPNREVLYSGQAADPSRAGVAEYLAFLDGLKR